MPFKSMHCPELHDHPGTSGVAAAKALAAFKASQQMRHSIIVDRWQIYINSVTGEVSGFLYGHVIRSFTLGDNPAQCPFPRPYYYLPLRHAQPEDPFPPHSPRGFVGSPIPFDANVFRLAKPYYVTAELDRIPLSEQMTLQVFRGVRLDPVEKHRTESWISVVKSLTAGIPLNRQWRRRLEWRRSLEWRRPWRAGRRGWRLDDGCEEEEEQHEDE